MAIHVTNTRFVRAECGKMAFWVACWGMRVTKWPKSLTATKMMESVNLFYISMVRWVYGNTFYNKSIRELLEHGFLEHLLLRSHLVCMVSAGLNPSGDPCATTLSENPLAVQLSVKPFFISWNLWNYRKLQFTTMFCCSLFCVYYWRPWTQPLPLPHYCHPCPLPLPLPWTQLVVVM